MVLLILTKWTSSASHQGTPAPLWRRSGHRGGVAAFSKVTKIVNFVQHVNGPTHNGRHTVYAFFFTLGLFLDSPCSVHLLGLIICVH